jgi:hypothetical protein
MDWAPVWHLNWTTCFTADTPVNPNSMEDEIEQKKQDSEPPAGPPTWVKYMGLSFQLFSIIGGGTWLGWWIHQKSGMNFPLWVLVGCFLSIAIAFYQLLKSTQADK